MGVEISNTWDLFLTAGYLPDPSSQMLLLKCRDFRGELIGGRYEIRSDRVAAEQSFRDAMVELGLDGVTYRAGVVSLTCPNRKHVFRCKLDGINLVQHHGSEISVGGGTLKIDGMSEIG